MHIGVFDLFKIGIGPSSSHTVGPMIAARLFALGLEADAVLSEIARVRVELFGSLGFTGKGHGTDVAVMLGLEGERPRSVDVDSVPSRVASIESEGRLRLLGRQLIAFFPAEAIVFQRSERLPLHSNALRFSAFAKSGVMLRERVYYSVGGGFVVDADGQPMGALPSESLRPVFPFTTAGELLSHTSANGLSVSALMMENEKVFQPEAQVKAGVLELWRAMEASVRRGCERDGVLPGGLRLKRRAPALMRKLKSHPAGSEDPLVAIDWVNLWALAVNEENAAGGRVVTAPTNGAAGIIPAVMHYYKRFVPGADDDGAVRFLLTAAAIGSLYKRNASFSGAEVGCQGEVGVACSMAAGALAEVMGGTPEQVENAAEIGMEHNLGLTCDPVGGLVQVPCIERNAMGAVKAINAARLALLGDGKHKVSLDRVIATMRQTGADMSTKYKETARGGLAVNVIEC